MVHRFFAIAVAAILDAVERCTDFLQSLSSGGVAMRAHIPLQAWRDPPHRSVLRPRVAVPHRNGIWMISPLTLAADAEKDDCSLFM
jgi:hypothetical protein